MTPSNFRRRARLAALIVAFSSFSILAAEPAARTHAAHPAAVHVRELEPWLQSVPSVRERIVWVAGNGKREPIDDWSPEMRRRLDEFYQRLCEGAADLQIHLPTLDKIAPSNGQAYFTADQAFDVYAAHVAHVLYVEANQLVPWSIQERPKVELDQLLAGHSYFARIVRSKAQNTYPAGIEPERDFTETPENTGLGELNGDPRVGYAFLAGETSAAHARLIADSELKTLVNLSAWLRDNVGHGPMDGDAREHAKTQRWLDQRLRPARGNHIALAMQGCHSSSKLMVDLARSVNIPLLHARSLDPKIGDGDGSLFSRSHGALVYGWGSPKTTRICWHTDELYAMPGCACFPIAARGGTLLSAEHADQLYFDEHWVTAQTLRKAGFTYHLELVHPGKGQGKNDRGDYEDRADYGTLCGGWKKNGDSDLSEFFQLSHDYVLCGAPLLSMAASHIIEAQLASNIKAYRGGFSDEELQLLRPIQDYARRADAGLKALGVQDGDQLNKLLKDKELHRGGNLLPAKQHKEVN